MNKTDLYYFNILKKEISRTFLEQNKIDIPINEWKGKDIVAFQEDLFTKVKAKVSEKWFYTYLKKDAKNLPRIDILTFLSEYVGFKNWHTFKANFKKGSLVEKSNSNRLIYVLVLLPVLFFAFYFYNVNNNFHFCFIDADKNEPIYSVLDIKIFQKNESPIYVKTDSLGCFDFFTKAKSIKFVVQSPYYKTDTITRFINTKTNNRVNLQTDDYALMLQYYTSGNIKDWKKRKEVLDHLFAKNARIYQLFSTTNTIEMYSKEEFIRKLTIPTSSLKGIKILSKTYKSGKIVKLKFMVK